MDFDSKYDKRTPPEEFTASEIHNLADKLQLDATIADISLLTGGYMNSNYKILTQENKLLTLRISNRSEATFKTEMAILKNLPSSIPAPKIVNYNSENKIHKKSYALLEYIPGEPLSKVWDKLQAADVKKIATDLGQILACIHQKTFPFSGFFNENFQLSPPIKDFRLELMSEVDRCLGDKRLIERIDRQFLTRIQNFFQESQSELLDNLEQACLTHSDFNPKNILVHCQKQEYRVTGILDWEFSFSGPKLFDFGNLFRFEEEMPGFESPLIKSYVKHGGNLQEDWRQVAKFLDLIPQLQFLSRPGETPTTFQTARQIIRNTLEEWNY